MSASIIGRILGLALAMAVVLSFGVTTVESAIPNNGTYYACLTKKTGAVKVINYPKKQCPAGTQLIKWNAKGPAGPAGPQGATGAQGPKGDQGPAGPADWNAIPNIPAGFADGVDNEAFASRIVVEHTLGPLASTTFQDVGPFSRIEDVDFHLIPTSIGFVDFQVVEIIGQPDGLYYALRVGNLGGTTVSFKIRATVHAQGVAPAALKRQLRNVEVGSVKIKRR